MNCLKRSRSPFTRRLSRPSASPADSIGPSGSASIWTVTLARRRACGTDHAGVVSAILTLPGTRLCQCLDAVLGTVSVLEEVPRLDDVAFGVLEVNGPVAAVVLHGSPVLDPACSQLAQEGVELPRLDGEREMHVPPTLVPELLGAAGPQAEPR